MRVKLIQPAMGRRPMDTSLKARMAPCLGLLVIARIVEDAGHDVRIVNGNVEADAPAEPVDLVGVTVTVDVFPAAREIARRYRERGVPVVAGGIFVTSCPEAARGAFDALCIGPAEGHWPRLLRDAAAGRLAPEYRNDPPVRGEDLLAPSYRSADPSRFLYTNVVATSRGCPFACDFCYNSCAAVRGSYAHRTVPDVLAEIRSLGTRHVMFIDDNFIGDPAFARELLEAMRPLRLRWNAAVSANVLDMPDLLDLMRDTGCRSLFVGFESLGEDALRGVHKRQNRASRHEALVEALHSRGIMVNASFVFGLDGDGPDVFRATVDWVVRNRVETVTSHILTPYPGTALHARMEAAGRIVDRDLSHYDTAHVVFRPANMTAEQLYEGYLRVYREIYSLRNIARRLPRSPRQWMPYLLFNLLYRKWGRATEAICRRVGYHRIGTLARLAGYAAR